MTLKQAVREQAPRYARITAPVVVIAGDADKTVWPDIHSRPFAATVPHAKLIILPGVGHMVQNAAPELVVREIDAMIARTRARTERGGELDSVISFPDLSVACRATPRNISASG